MTLLARDLMQTDPIAVSPETPLLHVHRLFVEEEINGAPVVDEDGAVLGVISSLDLLRAVQAEHDAGGDTTYFREFLPYSGPDWHDAPEDFQDRLGKLTAIDAAVTEVVWVRPDSPVPDIARIMREQRIHRVLVADDGVLVGILTTFDLLRLVEDGARLDEVERARRIH